jgi:hypothetical protein
MPTTREAKESPLTQGADEEIIYTLTTTPWGSTPTSLAVKVYDISSAKTDVTTTNMPTNSPTANGDVISLSPLKLLTAGKRYRVEVKFTSGGSVYEVYFHVDAEA